MTDITVTVIFHRENIYALPALASAKDLVEDARRLGINIEARAILDRPDESTKKIVELRGGWLDEIEEVNLGDLGLTRNAGVRSAKGKYLAFLDGDDLWGSKWLSLAYAAAVQKNLPDELIFHPELLYYFYESDFDCHSVTQQPHPDAKSFLFFHNSSNMLGFDKNILFINNIWSANVFAHRSVYEKNPYKAVARNSGFGVEDWSWNIDTVWRNYQHVIVEDTVHMIRVKQQGSLGAQNASEGILPFLADDAFPILG